MSRSVPWRRTCSDTVHWRQLQALQATVYVLQQTGPTAFLVKEGDSSKKLRVSIGDPSSCTCATFLKEKEVCVHILWIILKLFRIPPENPITWQGGLVEREIQQLVKSREQHNRSTAPAPALPNPTSSDTAAPTVQPRPIAQGDVCPICQDDMTPAQSLCYCRYSCGHSVHSRCMKEWADHQLTQGTAIHCPMCRADFGSLKSIMTQHLAQSAFRPNVHAGTHCKHCAVTPIEGKVYTCTICDDYLLCMKCFASNTHPHHPFQFREKPSQRWRPADRSNTAVTNVLAQNLQSRDITDNDYDTLLALDSPQGGQGGLSAKELSVLKSVMLKRGSTLLSDDSYCTLCLSNYTISQHVVTLPCHHNFHQLCAVNFLQHQHDYCPTCNVRVQVTLPRRKKVNVVRYNVKEEEEVVVPTDLTLAGASFSGNTTAGPSHSALRTIESYSPSNKAKPRARPKNMLPAYTSPITQPLTQPLSHGNFNIAFENNKSIQSGVVTQGSKKKHRMVSRGLVDNEFKPDLDQVFVGKKSEGVSTVGKSSFNQVVTRVIKHSKNSKAGPSLAGQGALGSINGKRISSS